MMERTISQSIASTPFGQKRIPEVKIPEMKVIMPARGSTGPVRIGKLLEPVQRIIRHPDRNGLMAEFFKDYK